MVDPADFMARSLPVIRIKVAKIMKSIRGAYSAVPNIVCVFAKLGPFVTTACKKWGMARIRAADVSPVNKSKPPKA